MERLGDRTPAIADVVVIGGGIAGLVAARECARVGLSVVLFETADRLGGSVRRVELGGIAVDAGASYFERGDGAVAELAAELGLGDDVLTSDERGVHVWVTGANDDGTGRALPLPADSMWGVPANPLAPDVREIVGGRGSMRAWADRLLPFLKIGRARSLGKLVRSRMGDAVAERLNRTVVYGLLTRDADLVDVDVIAPGLNEAVTRTGSLSGGVADVLGNRADGWLAGIRGGMGRLVDALVLDLQRFDARLETSSGVASIERLAEPLDFHEPEDAAAAALGEPPFRPSGEHRWLVTAVPLDDADADEQRVAARYVVLAAPARDSLGLLADLDASWRGLMAEQWHPGATDTMLLLVDAPELDGERRVVFVPRADPQLAARSVTDETARWEWLDGETGPGLRALRVHFDLEAHPEIEGFSDDELVDRALADAGLALGVELDRSRLVDSARVEHRETSAAYLLGQDARIAAVRKAAEADPTIELTGAWLAGPRLARLIPDARAAGRRIRRLAFRGAAGR